jgi:hypothetical protein
MKRINSHLCSVAYPILESAGVLERSRLRGEAKPLQAAARVRKSETPAALDDAALAKRTEPKAQP